MLNIAHCARSYLLVFFRVNIAHAGMHQWRLFLCLGFTPPCSTMLWPAILPKMLRSPTPFCVMRCQSTLGHCFGACVLTEKRTVKRCIEASIHHT